MITKRGRTQYVQKNSSRCSDGTHTHTYEYTPKTLGTHLVEKTKGGWLPAHRQQMFWPKPRPTGTNDVINKHASTYSTSNRSTCDPHQVPSTHPQRSCFPVRECEGYRTTPADMRLGVHAAMSMRAGTAMACNPRITTYPSKKFDTPKMVRLPSWYPEIPRKRVRLPTRLFCPCFWWPLFDPNLIHRGIFRIC